MEKDKLIEKLLGKYPELKKEPMFDELLGLDEEMPEGEGEDGIEIEIGKSSPEDKEEEDKAFGKMMYDDNEDKNLEDEMLSDAANSDKMLSERVREKMKARKYFSK